MTRRGLAHAAGLLPLALASLVAAVPPARGALPDGVAKVTTIEGITEYRLGNGLRVLLYPDSSTPKVTVNMTVFVGSRHEGYGETGMAHLLEHMLFKGTPTHREIPRELRDRGAEYNGTTWVDRTNYYETLNASDDNLAFAIALEADRLVHSLVRREDLASEMTVVRNEFEAGENDPPTVLSQRMFAAAYEWHNYGKVTIGNRSDIERVPIDRLQAFYRKHYQPDNVMLIVAGNFNPEKALALVARDFGPIPRPSRRLEDTYTEEPAQDGERTVVLRRVGAVGAVGAVYHVPSGPHPDFAAVEVLATLLDMEPSGRLYKALVEARKATAVSTIAFGWHDPGLLEVLASLDKDQDPPAVLDVLAKTLDEVRRGGVTEAEVARARVKLAKQRELQMAHTNRVGVALSEWASKGDWRLFFVHRDRVAAVTAADVSRVARTYLQPTNRTAGIYVPTKEVARAVIPATPDVASMMKDYKGGAAVAAGESFDPGLDNVRRRTQITTLPGGTKAALLPRKTRGQAVTLRLTLRYGNADSLKDDVVATRILPALMARGTKKHTRQQLVDELDKLQARLTPSGGTGEMTFQVECKRPNLPRVLELLREVLREPSLPEEEFTVLKRQLRSGLEESRTEPVALASRALQRKLSPYPKGDVRYTPTLEESLERLEATTVDRVRKLYAEQVGGEHAELAVVGDFDPAVLGALDDALKGWKSVVPYRRVEEPAVKGIKGERLVIEMPDKANAVFFAGLVFPMRDDDADAAALEVANFLLGGGSLSSRLGNRVRQKEGLSYGVGSQFEADSLDPSARLLLFAICNPANVERVDTAILEEVTKLRDAGVSAAELDEGRKAYLAQLRQRRSSDAQLLELLAEELFSGRGLTRHAELEKRVAALTAEEVGSAFRRHVDPKDLVIVRAGDFKKGSPGGR
jgi:zinc protease